LTDIYISGPLFLSTLLKREYKKGEWDGLQLTRKPQFITAAYLLTYLSLWFDISVVVLTASNN